MAKWEIDPFKSMGDNSPETAIEQIEDELDSMARRKIWLLEMLQHYNRELVKKYLGVASENP